MPTVEFEGATYRFPCLSAWDQNTILETMQPVVAGFRPQRHETPEDRSLRYAEAIIGCAHDLPDAKVAALLRITLGGVEVRDGEGVWLPVWDGDRNTAIGGRLTGLAALGLAIAVARASLARFFDHERVEFQSQGRRGPNYETVSAPGNLQWLTTPALRGIVRFESLRDGSVDLADIALINDLLAIEAENTSRASKAAEDEAASRQRG